MADLHTENGRDILKKEYPGSFRKPRLLISKRNSTENYGIDSIIFKVTNLENTPYRSR